MINVTCAVIRNEDNEVLVVQRGEKTDHPFKWEFPGGKIGPGEGEEDCIIREIDEELSMSIVISARLEPVSYDYGHKQVRLIPFICDTLDEMPVMSEHLAFRWVMPGDLASIDFCGADLLVVRQYLSAIDGRNDAELSVQETADPQVEDTELRDMIFNMIGIKEVEWIVTSASENPGLFLKLLSYSYSTDHKLAFRASWTLSKLFDRFPSMIKPHLSGIIEKLNQLENESTRRSFLRILSLSDLQELRPDHHGLLADHCFNALNSGFSAIAIKAYSMEILYKLAVIYPDLANELAVSVNMLKGEGSAGIEARGRIILKKLAEISSGPGSSQS
ncbi:MAG: (deoxy)nucleoside triphosphate pyrophosphohydrolase [Bacteroidales bacterium]